MRIAVFDYKIASTNPIGSCHLRMLTDLCTEHEFTVYAVEFENPRPDRIRHVRVPVPTRPLAAMFILFHLVAPIVYLIDRLRRGQRYDLIQMVESNLSYGDISYAHFCHRAFLREHWTAAGGRGVRGLLRRIDHGLHAMIEPWIFRRVRRIIVPSRGLSRELARTYPFAADKLVVLSNPIDIDRMKQPADFDRAAFRRSLELNPDDVALVFVALGQFERKGLPLLLEALRRIDHPRLKLIVVGGTDDLLATYRKRIESIGLSGRVRFTGLQKDVRPYLWAADAFTFPSHYETFSLVAFQAAAAGLPVIVTPLHGVEEFLIDGDNGYVVAPQVEALVARLQAFLNASPEARREVGRRAQQSMPPFSAQAFSRKWRETYAGEVA